MACSHGFSAPFYDLTYADDTVLIAGTAQRTEQLLTLVAHSNLQLNWSKSLLLKSPSSQNHVFNQHGEMLEHAKYLGVILSRNGSSKMDVTERLKKARKHFATLHHVWRHAALPIHWKLRIYNAVLLPMIVYGMESQD